MAVEQESIDDKLARLEAEKAKRDEEKLDAPAKLRKIEEHELEAKYTEELGPRGVDFEIVRTTRGCFVVTPGDFLAHKRFNAKAKKDVSEEDVIALVLPALQHPTRDVAALAFRERAGIAWKCAAAMRSLYEAEEVDRGGKA